MGCGSSVLKGANTDAAAPEKKGPASGKLKPGQLKKVTSQLGKKNIVNSFVVQKGRYRRRTSDQGEDLIRTGENSMTNGSRKNVVPRESDMDTILEEPAVGSGGSMIKLPAESGLLEEPDLKGVSASGPSFKMRRGLSSTLAAVDKEQAQELATGKALLYSDDPQHILQGASLFRDQLSVAKAPVAAIRASGVLPRLITLLKRDDLRQVQCHVAWTLTNICSAAHEDCQDVVDQGAVPQLVRLLETCDDALDVLQQAMWALGNIAADCPELQRHLLDEDILTPLMGCVNRHIDSTDVLRHAMWLLSNLSRPRPQATDLIACASTIASVITTPGQDQEVCTHACWSLAYITSVERGLQEVLEEANDVLAPLVAWVADPPSNLTAPALRVLGNLCSGSQHHTQAVLDAGALAALLKCLKCNTRLATRKEIVWIMSNIAAGSSSQVSTLLEAGVFSEVMTLLRNSEEVLARECVYVLANPWAQQVAIQPSVAQQLLDAGLVQVLVEMLSSSSPAAIIMLALDGLQDAIKRGQQMMRAAFTKLPPINPSAAAAAPSPTNPVAEALKVAGIMERLDELLSHPHEGLPSKVNSLKNMLQFL